MDDADPTTQRGHETDDVLRWGTGPLVELSPEECWELLGSREIGRIAWSGPHGPTLRPVNHAVSDGVLWLRTTAYSALAQQIDDSPVAYEADVLDDQTRAGWSVVVEGTAHLVYPGREGPTPPDLETWPAGPRPVWVEIVPREITGRRLHAG